MRCFGHDHGPRSVDTKLLRCNNCDGKTPSDYFNREDFSGAISDATVFTDWIWYDANVTTT